MTMKFNKKMTMKKLLFLVFFILQGNIKYSGANNNTNLTENTEYEKNLENMSNLYDKPDLYSSIGDLEKVLQVELLLIKNLNEFITRSMELITKMKISITNTKMIGNFNFIKKSRFLTNIRSDIQQLQINMKSFEKIQDIIRNQNFKSVPNFSDLKGVVRGIFLIQNIYNITTDQLIDGNITESIQMESKLSASDCLDIGLILSDFNHHSYAIEWFKSALKLLNIKKNQLIVKEINEINVIKHLVNSQYAIGDIENAFSAVKTIILTIQKDLMHKDSIEMAFNLGKYMDHYKNLKTTNKSLEFLTETDESTAALQMFCPRSNHKPPHIVKTLFCKYETKNHAYLKLAPFKIEIQNWDPYIAVFHDVISSNEIELLKNLSSKHLQRALVATTQDDGVQSYRTAKNHFIENDEHPIIDILQQRVSDMTGLSMETSEEFQIANYGIGGWYDLHYDAIDWIDNDIDVDSIYDEMGDRIATVLFYMSDVEYGGATVLPNTRTTIFPKQGTAAFWYNLHASGILDYYTLHSGCPVAVGSKWILNKWIRINGQYDRRPCLLYPDHKYADADRYIY